MKARDWLDSQDQSTFWWQDPSNSAAERYPSIDTMVLTAFSDWYHPHLIVEAIIDLEDQWGFCRSDWFMIGRTLYVTNDDILAMLKMMQ